MLDVRLGARWVNAHLPPRLRRIVARANRARVRGRTAHERWHSGFEHEISHWRTVFATDHAHVRWLSDPLGQVDVHSLLGQALALLGQHEVDILDVGSGPMTPVGHVFSGKTLHITAIDPLADQYAKLLDEIGIRPPVATIPGDGEHVLDQFGPNTFDIAVAMNTLDHTYDPFAVVENMIGVVRPGGMVLLDHRRNEAENRLYRGEHQWNLDEHDGRLVVWNPDRRVELDERLGTRASVQTGRRGDRIWAVITRANEAG